MTKKLASLVAVAALTGGALAAVVAPAPAIAGVGPGEDREITSPSAGWWAYDNLTFTQLTKTLSDRHARPTDIHVTVSTGKVRYSLAAVANSGAYKSAWYIATGLTPARVVAIAVAKHYRPTVFDCYPTSQGDRCATIMIPNTGANAQSFTIYEGTFTYIKSKVTTKNRPTALTRVQGANRYAAIFVANTGSNHVTWYWYRAGSDTGIVNAVLKHKARIVDFDRNNDTKTWNAVAYANPQHTTWYTYDNASLSTLVNRALQQGQRIYDVSAYPSGSTTKYAVVSVNDLNATSTQIAGRLAPKVPNGKWGFYFHQVGGSTVAALRPSVSFEPASTLKVLYHYKTITSEQAGTSHDSDPIAYQFDASHPIDGDICPDDFGSVGATNLMTADTSMMQASDNRFTKGVLTMYGKPAMLAMATHLGMTHTTINHNIGCPTAATHNATTLGDLNAVYTGYADAKDLTDSSWRALFRNRMLNQANYPAYLSSTCAVVTAEAQALNKSPATATAFCNQILWLAKGGSYQYGGNAVTSPVSWSNGSLTSLPFKTNGVIVRKSYFYGDYFDQVSFTTAAQKTALANARTSAYNDAIRGQVRAALATW
ncbi:MAG: hypothetical protein QOJ37_2493 [Pseudonocardiales bacterium]|jgi:hypothetical protein|nr:hypothetical protein [Pseudonocardiales bacterium]MDT4949898.1 hypothetical protein [Pseudonocardiales bacterium]